MPKRTWRITVDFEVQDLGEPDISQAYADAMQYLSDNLGPLPERIQPLDQIGDVHDYWEEEPDAEEAQP